MTRGFLRFLRGNTIALLALFIALGGTTYAAVSLPANSVGAKQLKKNAVINKKIQANAVTGAKVKNDSLTGADILESSLGTVPSATNAASAANANALDGIDSTGFLRSNATAGGDLAGTYPNPTIAAGHVTSSELGTITDRSAVSAAIAPGASGSITVNCLAGEKVLSGGNDGFTDYTAVIASRRNGTNGWAVFARNNAAVNRTVTVHAYCLAP